MHTAVHIIPRLFICISSLVSRGDNIDGIPRAALTRLAIRDASLEDFHTEGIVSIFKIVSSRERKKTTTFFDVEKFDRFQE